MYEGVMKAYTAYLNVNLNKDWQNFKEWIILIMRVKINHDGKRKWSVTEKVTENENKVTENDNRVTENDNRETENDNRLTENDNRVTENDNSIGIRSR